MELLPEEVLLIILGNLDLASLLGGIGATSWYFYWLVRRDLKWLNHNLTLDRDGLEWSLDEGQETIETKVDTLIGQFAPLKRLSLKNFPCKLVSSTLQSLSRHHHEGEGCALELSGCNCGEVSLLGLPLSINKLRLLSSCENIKTRMWEEMAVMPHCLTELTIPNVPSAFLPLILHNQRQIQVLSVGELSNQLVYMICNLLKRTLKELTFIGSQLTYSGVAGLTHCKAILKSLTLRHPKFLTKYSMALMARHLHKLESLQLQFTGKMLITNPWCFDYCLDRQEQRVDALFAEADLHCLTELDLSAFHQTVEDKTVQLVCAQHLSSHCCTEQHPKRISLAHCYRVGDAGIQWLVGSCHSPAIQWLDLSNTDLTGMCFARKMPFLSSLSLDCCSSLSGVGLLYIAASCPALTYFSVSKNKQLSDADFCPAFKHGLDKLEEFNVSYANINGQCLSAFRGQVLKRLHVNSCPKVKDETGLQSMLSKNCDSLLFLDLSGTSVTGTVFCQVMVMKNLKQLLLDFCSKLNRDILKVAFSQHQVPRLKKLSLYGVTQDIGEVEKLKKLYSIKEVIWTTGQESEEEMREFSRKRGLHLTNWMVTKKHLVKGNPMMLSQVWLSSLEDRA